MDADERRSAGQTGAASPALRRALGRLDGGHSKIKSAPTPNITATNATVATIAPPHFLFRRSL